MPIHRPPFLRRGRHAFLEFSLELCPKSFVRRRHWSFVGKNTFSKSCWLVLMKAPGPHSETRHGGIAERFDHRVRPRAVLGRPILFVLTIIVRAKTAVSNTESAEKRTKFGTVMLPHADEIMRESVLAKFEQQTLVHVRRPSIDVWKNRRTHGESTDIRAIAEAKPASLLSHAYNRIMNERGRSSSGTAEPSGRTQTQARR